MRTGCLAILLSQLAAILGFWAWNHVRHPMDNQLAGTLTGQLLAYGRLAGLLAAFGFLLQLVLVGRVRWVERVFGLDRLTRLHHTVGFALVVLLLGHPVLVTLGHASQAAVTAGEQFVDFLGNWEDVGAAAAALLIMIAALAFSVAVVMKRIRYEWWYATHLTFYLAIALAFGHQIAVGSDFTDNRWFKTYWLILYAFVFGNLLWYRVVRPLLAFVRHRFVVARLEPESADVTSVYIEGRNMPRFPARAGQFVIVRFLAAGFRWEAHPFSISAMPNASRIRLTIKRLGDFTRRIPDLKPGTRVFIDGPHGVFTAENCRVGKVLLIAGGIGITPVRSLAEDLANRGREMILIYGNRNRQAVVFEKELDELAAATGRLRIVHVMSDDPGWNGEKGRVDRERIARLVPDVLEREVFLCGPPVMMKMVRAALRDLGMPRARLHYERFSL